MSEAPYPTTDPAADGERTGDSERASSSGERGGQASPADALPRFSASASVPVPPAPPVPPAGQPSASADPFGYPTGHASPTSLFGQGSPYGMPPGPDSPFGQPPPLGPPPAASGVARASGSASVPAASPYESPYGAPAQGYPAQPGSLGGPPEAGQSSGGAAPGYGGAAPGYGSGEVPGFASYGGGAVSPTTPVSPPLPVSVSPPQQRSSPASPLLTGPSGQPGYGEPPDPRTVPVGPWPDAQQPPEVQQPTRSSQSRRGLLIVSLVVAAVVVAVGGAFVAWRLTDASSSFTVGTCVVQDGSDAAIAECSAPHTYKIIGIVETENGCADARQPSLVLTERVGGRQTWACLEPNGGPSASP